MTRIKSNIWLLGSLLILCSCRSDQLFTPDTDPSSETAEVTFSLLFPTDLLTTGTKSAAARPIERLDILGFKEQGGVLVFSYRVTTSGVVDTGEETKKQVTVKMPVDPDPHRIVVLANLEASVIDAFVNGPDNSMNDLRDLTHTYDQKWEAEKAIPMWGEVSQPVTVQGPNTSFEVGLLRMLARVDLIMNLPDPELFQLKEVYLFNSNSVGHVVPHPDSLVHAGSKVTAKGPTIPTDPGKRPNTDPIFYSAGDDNFVKGMYVYEAYQDANQAREIAPCLVIGGMYNHDPQMTYYRVNLFLRSEDGLNEYYPDVVRNYLYQLKINAIYGRGYDDKETALISSPSVSSSLLVLDQSDSDIIFDGTDYLAVSESVYEFPRNDTTASLRITTTFPRSELTVNTDSETGQWLSFTTRNGATGVTWVDFTLDKNEEDKTRQGYITVKAGNFRQEVLINQTTDDRIALSIRDRYGNDVTELVFSSHINDLSVVAQELHVSWSPASSVCIISATDGTTPFVYGKGSAMLGDGTSAHGGSEIFTIYPKALTPEEVTADPFIEKVKYLDFLVTDGEYYSVKRIALRQVNYALLVNGDLENHVHDYLMGKPYTGSVTSNADWFYSAMSVYDTDDFFEYARREGTEFHFKIKQNDAWYGRSFRLRFYSTNPDQYFEPVYVEVRAMKIFPNCYIVKPGEYVTIPMAPVYDIYEKWLGYRPSGATSVDLIWKDFSGTPVTVGKTSDENLYVRPLAGQTGNAVVGMYVSGQLVWTWHIWITDYDPQSENFVYTTDGYTNTFMDRNLGATVVSSSASVDNLGFYYQWGRKEPFPGSANVSSNGSHRAIYDNQDNPLTVATIPVPASGNLEQAWQNPLTFISSPTYPYDWYTTDRGGQNDVLWHDEEGYKTVFDPCPQGWRVPFIRNGVSPWSNVASVTNANNAVTFSQFGRYPLAGNISHETGRIDGIPRRNYNWQANPATEAAYGFTAGYYSIDATDIRYRAMGANVRCVKEQGE